MALDSTVYADAARRSPAGQARGEARPLRPADGRQLRGLVARGLGGSGEERDELRVRVGKLEAELKDVRELERDLRDMPAAQRVAKELRDSGEKERDEIVKAAHEEATSFRQAMASERGGSRPRSDASARSTLR